MAEPAQEGSRGREASAPASFEIREGSPLTNEPDLKSVGGSFPVAPVAIFDEGPGGISWIGNVTDFSANGTLMRDGASDFPREPGAVVSSSKTQV